MIIRVRNRLIIVTDQHPYKNSLICLYTNLSVKMCIKINYSESQILSIASHCLWRNLILLIDFTIV